ncbi:hypothetical protein HK102_007165 [Quaeritorhiza haematococci]|nr:hypothetical protein HK102_007165 [Quaeritorhiza haematococci]
MGTIRDAKDKLNRTVSQPVRIKFDSQLRSFEPGAEVTSQDLTFAITTGDLNSYPFDSYTDEFFVSGLGPTVVNAAGQNVSDIVPIAFSIVGALQSWSVELEVDGKTFEPNVRVIVRINRSFTTKFFSMFVVSVMWLLSLFVLTLAITVWTRGRKVEPPTIAFVTGMLFALPAVRNVQPGAPPIGCTADVCGFFWNLFMVSLAALLLIANYIVKYKGEAPKPSPPPSLNHYAASTVHSSGPIHVSYEKSLTP